MELLGAPYELATSVRPRYCRCFGREEPHAHFIVRSRCLSAPSPPSSFRVQIQFHPWSKQLFRIIPKAQSGQLVTPNEFADDSNDVSAADQLVSLQRKVKREVWGKEAIERLDKQLLEGVKPPYAEYLMDLGLDLDDIKRIVKRYHCIEYRSVDREIRPFVEVLLNFGVDHSGLLDILRRCPQAMGMSIEKRFMPSMEYLESLGMDKEQCIKALCRFPQFTALTREKIEAKVAYFLERGFSAENVQKMIAHSPQILGMTVEKKLSPTTEFFLAKGFTTEVVHTMVVKFPNIYNVSLTKSIIPKWEFFLEMGYPTLVLANFPHYFGYSLEGRIKPRHKLAMEHGVRLHLTTLLNTPVRDFEMQMEKLVSKRNAKDGG